MRRIALLALPLALAVFAAGCGSSDDQPPATDVDTGVATVDTGATSDTGATTDTGATDDTGSDTGSSVDSGVADTGVAADSGSDARVDAPDTALPTFNQFVIDLVQNKTNATGKPTIIEPPPFMPPPAPEKDDPTAFKSILP